MDVKERAEEEAEKEAQPTSTPFCAKTFPTTLASPPEIQDTCENSVES